ncbi:MULTISPECIES: succinate dehydrogenase, cytochrome b556 subunit [Clavibacter]|uniref:Succinate dehydrogenase, cytochrome b556 subunit n=1 Tax=Clavibacter phaseoli TaxID=1734031 RepID=A0A8I0S6G2_9MICO|nr:MULTISPECIES: succinate dehydrogenase, cytochrome b556 subunit [Clavibacter]MWJ25062.1 succinate dehydrogenase, cytochrome b556 subunit [Clavibacter michiganensis subsp. michiganensis]MBF4630367.1 succinate dehydrogenase, cytochrome b556 subunit [Clavibacter phaseoli]MBM7389037.1 succinate dehydrogenase / fumarate reductase cytochrome b subunit [Clavibacter michiganensis]MBP2457655.1 succinate dehydrogenase / fumarate reductase cytochrome b subunit [Clavibacter michiganensis]MCJ1710414.1 su
MSIKTAGTREPHTSRAPKVPAGTLYRGREGMWSWVLHRITGVSIFFFLLVHVLDTSLIRVSPEAYNAVIGTYKNPVMGIGEVALVGAIGFHALNGLRIILIDFWRFGAKHQRLMFYVVIGLWVVLMAGFVPRHLINVFSEAGWI